MDEIKALEEISEIMSRFPLKDQRRMIWWLNARLIQRTEANIKERAEVAAAAYGGGM